MVVVRGREVSRSEKKSTMQSGKPKCLRIKVSILWFKEGKNCAISNASVKVINMH